MDEFFLIKQTSGQVEGVCKCGHTGAAHGSNGFVCCIGGCKCKKFIEEFDSRFPTKTKVEENA